MKRRRQPVCSALRLTATPVHEARLARASSARHLLASAKKLLGSRSSAGERRELCERIGNRLRCLSALEARRRAHLIALIETCPQMAGGAGRSTGGLAASIRETSCARAGAPELRPSRWPDPPERQRLALLLGGIGGGAQTIRVSRRVRAAQPAQRPSAWRIWSIATRGGTSAGSTDFSKQLRGAREIHHRLLGLLTPIPRSRACSRGATRVPDAGLIGEHLLEVRPTDHPFAADLFRWQAPHSPKAAPSRDFHP